MWTVIDSPVGDLRLVERDGALTAIEFSPFRDGDGRPRGDRDDANPVLVETARQLRAYFARELTDFDLPLAPVGSDFQQRVWKELQLIDFGQTASYGEIALRLGMTNAASRAVGLANGRNPIPIVIPCHRVIGANGTLTGYAGASSASSCCWSWSRTRCSDDSSVVGARCETADQTADESGFIVGGGAAQRLREPLGGGQHRGGVHAPGLSRQPLERAGHRDCGDHLAAGGAHRRGHRRDALLALADRLSPPPTPDAGERGRRERRVVQPALHALRVLPGQQDLGGRTGAHRQLRAHRDRVAQTGGALGSGDAHAVLALAAPQLR